MRNGYSDRINHALAFAAKHHDQQVRRGRRLPYSTHSANIGIILTRYEQDDDCVVSGILHNVVADYTSDGFTRERMDERIGAKFGAVVLDTILEVTERRHDEDGVELAQDERKNDFLARLSSAGERARWVAAAEKLHGCASLLADLRRTEFRETVWSRQPNGRENTLKSFRIVHDKLRSAGFSAPIMAELSQTIEELEQFPE